MTGTLLAVAAGGLTFASQASAANTCGTNGTLSVSGIVYTCTYTTSGEDTFTAPLFVDTVQIVAVGQTGGVACAFENVDNSGNGGAGARVAANVPVTQPTLFVEIPHSSSSGPGCDAGSGQIATSGGGGGGSGLAPGGGASVVQTCSVNASCLLTGNPQTDPRLVVAGGGGGAAIKNMDGGDAGTGGNSMCNPGLSGLGAPMFSVSAGGGAGGGCQSSFGFGVGGHGGDGAGGFSANGQAGDNGELGPGGNGGDPATHPVSVPGCDFAWQGAGGGSGFWGGGGGGGAAYCNGGGGGGGSSYAEPHATNVSMTLADGATPEVTISWYRPSNREFQFLTGRAFGLSFTQPTPESLFSVTVADTGPVQTSLTYTAKPPCQLTLNSPVGGSGTTLSAVQMCAEVKTTGGNTSQSSSIAASETGLLALKMPGLPIVRARTVLAYSKSTCAGSAGVTLIGFLEIGSDVVISHSTSIAPNTHLTVGPLQVTLNAQTPFATSSEKGLLVDGIDLSVGPPSSVTAHLTVASSESDIGDCPGEVNVP